MRAVLAALIALGLTGTALPAEAAIVYTRDGRNAEGALKVEGSGLVVTLAGGRTVIIPYDQVLGVSMDDKPLFPPPKRVEASKVLNSDWVLWTLVLANVVTIAAAGFTVYRATQPGTPATR